MMNVTAARLLRRLGIPGRDARLGIGKRMGTAVWVAAPYAEDAFGATAVRRAVEAAARLGLSGHAVVRMDAADGSVGLLWSDDFDQAHEPIVGTAFLLRADGTARVTRPPADPLIWHHKWAFVPERHAGFDVERSVERSIEWRTAVGTSSALSSRIGRLSFWDALLDRLGLEPRLPPTGPRP